MRVLWVVLVMGCTQPVEPWYCARVDYALPPGQPGIQYVCRCGDTPPSGTPVEQCP